MKTVEFVLEIAVPAILASLAVSISIMVTHAIRARRRRRAFKRNK